MQVQNLPITRSTTIEVLIPNSSTSNQFAFPDMPYLRNRTICAITLSSSQYTIQSGRTNLGYRYTYGQLPFSQVYPFFVTLVDSDNIQFLQNMPHPEFIANQALGVATPTQGNFSTNGIVVIRPRTIVWPKSFLYFPNPLIAAGFSVQFQIFYK